MSSGPASPYCRRMMLGLGRSYRNESKSPYRADAAYNEDDVTPRNSDDLYIVSINWQKMDVLTVNGTTKQESALLSFGFSHYHHKKTYYVSRAAAFRTILCENPGEG